jgi:predicted dehydrogenase
VDAFIVGAGASGFLHALALRSAGVRIEKVYDPCKERAAWLAELCGAETASTLETSSDVVAICSPPAFHVAQAEALAREGRTTFLEKPVACDPAELERLAELPGLVPILQWRAGRSAHQLRAAFGAGTFGPGARITCDFRLWRDADYWRTRANDAWPCGAMLSIGIHAVDLILWCVGRSVVRSSLSDSRVRGALDLEFEDATTAEIRVALDVPGRNDFRLRVRGPQASADLLASEEDPTATPLRWQGAEPPPVTTGATGSPLLVPYVHAALAGEHIRVRDVAAAHALSAKPRDGDLERDSALCRARATPSPRRAST